MNKIIKLAIITLAFTLTVNAVFSQTPTTADGWKDLATKQLEMKKYDEAAASFTKCFEISSAFSSDLRLNVNAQVCLLGRGLTYQSHKKYPEAIKDFTKAIEINPRSIKAFDYRGNVYRDTEEYEKAVSDYTKAIEFNSLSADLHYKRGWVYFELESDRKAEIDFSKAIDLDRNYKNAYLDRSGVYCEQGKIALAKADEQKFAQFGGKVNYPCKMPTSAAGWFRMGEKQAAVENESGAIESFTKAIAVDPKYIDAYKRRADMYFIQKNFDKLLADYSKLIELAPTNARYYFIRAEIYSLGIQKYELALADMNNAIRLDSNFPDNFVMRSDIYHKTKKYELEVADLTTAIKLKPDEVNYYIFRARAYCDQGSKTQAKADEQKAVALGGKIEEPCK